MDLKRIFLTDPYKCTELYLKKQRIYVLVRTILLFGISLAIFLVGFLTTKTRANLLTVIAVLGCLPASKSLVNTIMFFRFPPFDGSDYRKILEHQGTVFCLYDCIFTTYSVSFPISVIAIRNNTLSCYVPKHDVNEKDFLKHLQETLKLDGISDVSCKIYSQLQPYLVRLDQLNQMDGNNAFEEKIGETVKSVCL